MAVLRTGPVSPWRRVGVAAGCALAIIAIAVSDRYRDPTVSLQTLYLLPLVVAAAFVPWWSVVGLAMAAAIASTLGGDPGSAVFTHRARMDLLAFAGVGLFVAELARHGKKIAETLGRTHEEAQQHVDSISEMRAVLEFSPIGLLTVDSQGRIGMANSSACRLLGFSSGTPEGEPVERYFPALASLRLSRKVTALVQTMMEAAGRRRNGETFLSQACVSHYNDGSGSCLALVLSDVTELIRDREETGLKQLLSNSRIIAGAVSHELRNLAAAASVLRLNLGKMEGLKENIDFQALETVIDSMLRLSSTELADASEGVMEGLDVSDLLLELRTIISPELADAGIHSKWEIPDSLPAVRADRSGLLQVLLNLTKNSRRAVQNTPEASIRVAAYALDQSVVIRVADNGPGIPAPERLFQPFQPGASSTGLGLFVSRAIIRTFGGELHHIRPPGECAFLIDLPAMQVEN
jgi:two-component system, LuxR family, sensor kinase FixL